MKLSDLAVFLGQKATVIVDRGMAYQENLDEIRSCGLHYLVAARQAERNEWLDALEDENDWEEVVRAPSPQNPFQKKSRVEVKRRTKGDEVHILCRSEGRAEKHRAIREKHAQKLLQDLQRLEQRVAKGRLKQDDKIQQAIGRLLERYPRVARYYRIAQNNRSKSVWTLFQRKLLNNQTVWPVIFGLTGPICARTLKSLHPFELHPRGHHDWPVKPLIRRNKSCPGRSKPTRKP